MPRSTTAPARTPAARKTKQSGKSAETRHDEAVEMTFPASDPVTSGNATANEQPSRPADRQAPIISREEIERASTGTDSSEQDKTDQLDRKKASSKKRTDSTR